MKISAVILTKNEEENIKNCIDQLSFCDEIIVVDDNSIDKTREIAKKLGARVYIRDMDKDFSAQSNFGMKKAKEKWVLFVDADERISKELGLEIGSSIGKIGINGYWIKRIDYLLGRRLRFGETRNKYILRLARRGSGKWKRRVHPSFEILGQTNKIKHPIHHYPHEKLSDFVKSVDLWSSWHALANKEEGKRPNTVKIAIWPIAKFINNYIIKLGFLDGIHGFVHAFFVSFHSYLAWSKQWLNQK